MQWLWVFLPDEALVLVIVLIGLALMVRFWGRDPLDGCWAVSY